MEMTLKQGGLYSVLYTNAFSSDIIYRFNISESNIAKINKCIKQILLVFFMFKSPISEYKQALVRLDAQDPKRNIW